MIKLNNYLRQYRHNDNSDLVFGYEREGTEAFVSCLEQEIAELKQLAETKNARTLERIGRIEQQEREISELKASHRNELSKVNSDVQHILSTGVTIAKNLDGAASEIECLKKQVSQLKSENSSMAAYAEQRINMLTRVNNKLREGKS